MHKLRDFTAIFWFLAAIFVLIFQAYLPARDWLLIHLVLLGALTHSAFVWSEYFARTLLKTRPRDDDDKQFNLRTGLLAVGSSFVLIGYPAQLWVLVLIGAVAIVCAIALHLRFLFWNLRRALPGRWRLVVKYYVAAAFFLPLGASFGVLLAFGVTDEWRARLIIAHILVNVLGWIGFTVIGTLVTFWATIVRARMHPKTELWAKQSFWVFVSGIVIGMAGVLTGLQYLAAAGVLIYLGALIWWGRALITPVRAKGLREFAPASVAVAVLWAILGLFIFAAVVIVAADWVALLDFLPRFGLYFAAAFAIQILWGALSYLIPSLLGGGPAVLRLTQGVFNQFASFRIIVPNVVLVLLLLPLALPIQVRFMLVTLAAFAYLIFIFLIFRAVSLRARKVAANES